MSFKSARILTLSAITATLTLLAAAPAATSDPGACVGGSWPTTITCTTAA